MKLHAPSLINYKKDIDIYLEIDHDFQLPSIELSVWLRAV